MTEPCVKLIAQSLLSLALSLRHCCRMRWRRFFIRSFAESVPS